MSTTQFCIKLQFLTIVVGLEISWVIKYTMSKYFCQLLFPLHTYKYGFIHESTEASYSYHNLSFITEHLHSLAGMTDLFKLSKKWRNIPHT